MLVQPTPPREPTTATTSDSARVAPPAVPLPSPLVPRPCRSRCRASSSSSSTTGAVRNSLAPARRACRIDWPSPRALTARIGIAGNSLVSC